MPDSGMVASGCCYSDVQRGRWGRGQNDVKNVPCGAEKSLSGWSGRQGPCKYEGESVRRQTSLVLHRDWERCPEGKAVPSNGFSLWNDLREPRMRMPSEGLPAWKQLSGAVLWRLCLQGAWRLWSKQVRLYLELTGLANIIHIEPISQKLDIWEVWIMEACT